LGCKLFDALLRKLGRDMGKSLRIESCSFGALIINGKTYTSDLIIYPDGEVMTPWRRNRGHQLSHEDISELIESSAEIIIAGTGVSGMVKPEKKLEKILSNLGIQLIAEPNQTAIELFNQWTSKKRVGACFHLTC